EAFVGEHFRDRVLRGLDPIGRQERDAGRVRAGRRQLEVDDRAIKLVRRLHEDARAVAGVGLGAGRARVVQATDRGQRLLDDVVTRAALDVDDEPHAARVVLEAGIVERGKLAFAIGRFAIKLGHTAVVLESRAVSSGWELATAGR